MQKKQCRQKSTSAVVRALEPRKLFQRAKAVNFDDYAADIEDRGGRTGSTHWISGFQPDAAGAGSFMGRHSGFWMSIGLTAIAAVATTLRLLAGGTPESDTEFDEESLRSATVLQAGVVCRLGPAAHNHSDETECSVELTSVPTGAVIVIGSLDTTGARHTVRINAGQSHSAFTSVDSSPAPVRRSHAEAAYALAGWGRSAAKPPAISCRKHGTGRKPHSAEIPSVRQFLIPHFEDSATVQQPATAVRIAESTRVAVFIDAAFCDGRDQSADSTSMDAQIALAQHICDRLERGRIDQIAHWIGPIADMDCDERLTIVLTDLDRRSVPNDTPILGCVRDRDFAPSKSEDTLAGDIIYLNHRLPDGAELDALLVHELTHAAVYCLKTDAMAGQNCDAEASRFSAWLNEAIAHVLEMKLAAPSIGFADRIARFKSDPATCPIVADESHLPLIARRGGSRAAAALFLEPYIDSPDDIAVLLDERSSFIDRFQTMSGRSFAEEFRAWSIGHAVPNCSASAITTDVHDELRTPSDLRNDTQSAFRLYGTAFVALQCRESVGRLIITSDKSSQLQITILE